MGVILVGTGMVEVVGEAAGYCRSFPLFTIRSAKGLYTGPQNGKRIETVKCLLPKYAGGDYYLVSPTVFYFVLVFRFC